MPLSIAELNRLAADTGCKLHDDCLTCPFPECIYNMPLGDRMSIASKIRHDRIRYLAKSMNVKDIAEQLGISTRTVQRALKEQ